MPPLLRSLLLLFAGIALAITGIGAFNTLTALRMDIAGFDMRSIGIVLAIHCTGFVVGSWVAAPVIRRLGVRASFTLFALICAAAALLHLVSVTPLAWGIVRFWFGFGNGALSVSYESWINAATGNAWRGRVMAGYMTINYLGYAVGQMLLSPFPPGGWSLFAVVASLLALACLPVLRAPTPAIEAAPVSAMSLRALAIRAPLGVIGTFAAGLIIGGFSHLAPIFARGIKDDEGFIAWFMTLTMLSAFLVQSPVGWLSDRVGRAPVLVAAGVSSAFAAHLLATMIPGDQTALTTGLVLFGVSGYGIYGISVAAANDRLETAEMVSASGHLLASFGIGTIFGPLAGSFAMEHMGPPGLFVFIAAVGMMLAVLGLGLGGKRQTV